MNFNDFPISVCMASYNGHKFIKAQIESIVSQFSNIKDQLIIVDDCSKDNTVEIINQINNPNIKLVINKENMGVVKTFEKAIYLARNPLIFLSDQDDIWMSHKISVYKTAYARNKNINLLFSDHFLIDENSKLVAKSFLDKQMPLKIRIPLFNTRCHGPGIAFSQGAKKIILPFPKNISSHDKWIALIISIFGNIKFINVPCQFYRLHKDQICSIGTGSRRPIFIIIKSRLYTIFSIFKRLIKVLS